MSNLSFNIKYIKVHSRYFSIYSVHWVAIYNIKCDIFTLVFLVIGSNIKVTPIL